MPSAQCIQGAQHPFAPAIQDVGVNHGRGYVRMPQQFLHRADVLAGLE